MNQQEVPYYKYLNTGKKIKNLGTANSTTDVDSRIVADEIERDIGSSDSLEFVSVSESLVGQPSIILVLYCLRLQNLVQAH